MISPNGLVIHSDIQYQHQTDDSRCDHDYDRDAVGDGCSVPLPRDLDPDLPSCIQRDVNVLSHDAIKLKTMAQFRVEFDRNVDESVTVPGMLLAIQSHLDAMPDCGHGPPIGSAVTNINWHPELDRMQLQHATSTMATSCSMSWML